jgi:hypothetical protein
MTFNTNPFRQAILLVNYTHKAKSPPPPQSAARFSVTIALIVSHYQSIYHRPEYKINYTKLQATLRFRK